MNNDMNLSATDKVTLLNLKLNYWFVLSRAAHGYKSTTVAQLPHIT
jgi:hypothetical protein